MAVKSEMGEDGFDLWDSWSRTSERYKKAAALAVWRSIKPQGGITVRTLYRLARDYGWQGDDAATRIAVPARKNGMPRVDRGRRNKPPGSSAKPKQVRTHT